MRIIFAALGATILVVCSLIFSPPEWAIYMFWTLVYHNLYDSLGKEDKI